ncbi:hypothetical protein ACH5RR_038176 [Cinchona calisaya]|uniref:RING-type domain-containing protein n=1 Tax=Cinchona calisaya TaxID=153742 RepID=A0ABD2Y8D8_9GENT
MTENEKEGRDVVNGILGGNFMGGNNPMYGGAAMGYGLVSGTTVDTPVIPTPMYGTTMATADSIPVKTPLKSDSGLTYSVPIPTPAVVSRKRPRDDGAAAGITDHHQLLSFPANNNRSGSVTFLGEDLPFQIHQQQLEIDQLIAQHTVKMRREIEEQRKSYSRKIIRSLEENIAKRLKAKEDEIENIGKLNWALEEKLKSLYVENQIWRELAQNNEATANALRNNLEQVLAQAQVQNQTRRITSDYDDDAESCFGSNSVIEEEEEGCSNDRRLLCRNCGKEEASVLVLPCRHLCLCYGCGTNTNITTLHSCPVCLSSNNATLHINLSSPSSS